MSRFQKVDVLKYLTLPLGKKVDQNFVEKWSTSFWAGAKKNRSNSEDAFVMLFPPPNITGNLHLGHALTASVQDALIRQKQMQGKKAVWIPGFDHAGLATQNVVEKVLWNQKRITRQELGREEFVKVADEWKNLKRDEMRNQLDRLGLALDYKKEYFTMDQSSSQAVDAAFKQLFNMGLIYRSVKPVFWSNELQTTLSDIEVEKVDGEHSYSRTGERVEKRPIIQWFINTKDMAHKAVKVVEDGSIGIIPVNYKRSWSSWLISSGVEDWCISRQSWWGHRIPAYRLKTTEDSQENWIISNSLDEASQVLQCRPDEVTQDTDVLDTWFSSSLLPLSTAGWPDVKKFQASQEAGMFPLDIMETGFDILNFWVSKMVMTSIVLTGRIPFKLILLHGMICDSEGKKMSKSKGNVIDPLDVINGASLKELQGKSKESHSQGILDDKQLTFVLNNQAKLFPNGVPACGTDGLRAYLLSHDIQEEVVRVQVDQIEKVRRLSNKIWNIYRFVITVLETARSSESSFNFELTQQDYIKLTETDQQVLYELNNCVKTAHESFCQTYQLHKCFSTLEGFWLNHLSTKYIQNIKPALVDLNCNSHDKILKLKVLVSCLVTSTKLTHPFMPHLTEYLYQYLMVSLMKKETREQNMENLSMLSQEIFPKYEDGLKYT